MNDALATYQAMRAHADGVQAAKLFDLRVRVARVDDALSLLRTEMAKCRLTDSNRGRATVPCDDLNEAISFLGNHRTQLELTEARVLDAAL